MSTTDPLEVLLADGIIDEVLGRLKSGKEATISLVRRGDDVIAAKVYKDRATRSFKNSVGYKEGRKVRNSRTQRAMDSGGQFGKDAAEQEWKSAEADALYRLVDSGVRVPQPHLFYEGVLLMDLVRDTEGRAAPRMIDVAIEKDAAIGIYADLCAQIISMLCCDLIHGDLSPYNILAAAAGPTIIDFPQVVSAVHNSRAEYYFLRDFDNVVGFIAGFDPALAVHRADGRAIWRAYVSRDLTPEFVPPPPPPPRATRGPDRRGPDPRREGRGPREGGAPRPFRDGGGPPRDAGGGPRPFRDGGGAPRDAGGGPRPFRDGGGPPREGGAPRDAGGGPRPFRDGGGPPRDAGGGPRPFRDGGGPPREGGAPRDAGGGPRPFRDGGGPPRAFRDGGGPPRDGGGPRPFRDGGGPPRDGGGPRPFRDGGGPPRDAGGPRPFRDGGGPPRDGGAPRPLRDGGGPPRDAGGPRPFRDGGGPRGDARTHGGPAPGGAAPARRDAPPASAPVDRRPASELWPMPALRERAARPAGGPRRRPKRRF